MAPHDDAEAFFRAAVDDSGCGGRGMPHGDDLATAIAIDCEMVMCERSAPAAEPERANNGNALRL